MMVNESVTGRRADRELLWINTYFWHMRKKQELRLLKIRNREGTKPIWKFFVTVQQVSAFTALTVRK
jgi:hypothetical protein